jgi:hypothetical protein
VAGKKVALKKVQKAKLKNGTGKAKKASGKHQGPARANGGNKGISGAKQGNKGSAPTKGGKQGAGKGAAKKGKGKGAAAAPMETKLDGAGMNDQMDDYWGKTPVGLDKQMDAYMSHRDQPAADPTPIAAPAAAAAAE